MEVWDVRKDDEADKDVPSCAECGRPLVEAEDVEEGLHFLCGDFAEIEAEQEYDEAQAEEAEAEAAWEREREEMYREGGFPGYYDEGGESG